MTVDDTFMDRMRAKQRNKEADRAVNAKVDGIIAKMEAGGASVASLMLVHGTYRAFCLDLSALAASNNRPTDAELSDAFVNMLLKGVEGTEFSAIGERMQGIFNEAAQSVNEILSNAMDTSANNEDPTTH